jgi:hypothetical protein
MYAILAKSAVKQFETTSYLCPFKIIHKKIKKKLKSIIYFLNKEIIPVLYFIDFFFFFFFGQVW